jgi:hypothetical protein
MKDRDGRTLNTPEGGMDHFLDGARYAMSTFHPIERQESQVIEYSDDVLYADIGI